MIVMYNFSLYVKQSLILYKEQTQIITKIEYYI